MAVVLGVFFDFKVLLGGDQYTGDIVVKFTGKVEKIQPGLGSIQTVIGQYHVN